MTDPIDSVRRSREISNTERILETRSVAPVKRDHGENDFDFEDKIDIAPEEHLHNAPEIIDLSLEMIRALAKGELPEEAITALESFAPIGDMTNALAQCDRVEAKGMDYINWDKIQTLSYALDFAAS